MIWSKNNNRMPNTLVISKGLIFLKCLQNFTAIIVNTVFPQIVSAETILFWKLERGKYSREESIQGRKL